jgi:HK97 family phage major capsid protein
MRTLQQLIDKRAAIWNSMTEVMERSKAAEAMSAEDSATYDRAQADLEQVDAEIKRMEAHAALEARFNDVDRSDVLGQRTAEQAGEAGRGGDTSERSTAEQYVDAFNAYLRGGMSGLSAEQRTVLAGGQQEVRAQASTPASAGGFLIPEGFWAKVTETMKAFGGVMSVANVLVTATGQKLPWPTNDDTGNVGEQLGENQAVSEQDLVFGSKELDAFIFSSKMVKIPWALLQDEQIGLENYLARKLGERLGRIHNLRQTTGNGTTQPEGLLTNAVVGKTTAAGQVAAVTYDDLVDLEHSVDPAYRAGGRCGYMFTDLTLRSLRKVKDSEGRPLWEPSLQTGVPTTFNGRPYTINQDMPNLAANAKAIAFGDFEAGFVVRTVKEATLVRLGERFAESLQVGFFAYDRMDSAQDDAAAYRVLQQAAD